MISIGSSTRSRSIKKYEGDVLKILREKPDARDDDYALFYYFLSGKGYNLKTMTAYQMLVRLSTKGLPSFISITRARRKVQENHPDTRGTKWEARHKRAVEVRDEMLE